VLFSNLYMAQSVRCGSRKVKVGGEMRKGCKQQNNLTVITHLKVGELEDRDKALVALLISRAFEYTNTPIPDNEKNIVIFSTKSFRRRLKSIKASEQECAKFVLPFIASKAAVPIDIHGQHVLVNRDFFALIIKSSHPVFKVNGQGQSMAPGLEGLDISLQSSNKQQTETDVSDIPASNEPDALHSRAIVTPGFEAFK
jgi:hypothetical protein